MLTFTLDPELSMFNSLNLYFTSKDQVNDPKYKSFTIYGKEDSLDTVNHLDGIKQTMMDEFSPQKYSFKNDSIVRSPITHCVHINLNNYIDKELWLGAINPEDKIYDQYISLNLNIILKLRMKIILSLHIYASNTKRLFL